LTESTVNERLADFNAKYPGITLGFRAKFPEIHIKFYLQGDHVKQMTEQMENAGKWVYQRIGDNVFSFEELSMEAEVGRLLRRLKATLATAESCTGGLIAHLLTNVPGSSAYFLCSAVTYANEAKINVLGVSPNTLNRVGAVHEETVKEMALGVRRIANATYGIAVSGIAGPDGGSDEKPVGTICIGLADPDEVRAYRFHFPFGDRRMKKVIFATKALDILRRKLLVL
jgi:nicotinamide-nucleotide amidase